MRYLRYLVLAAVAVVLIVVALANRDPVMLHLLPPDLVPLAGLQHSIEVPQFLVMFAALGVGILIGFVWEWLRGHRNRAAAARQSRELRALKRGADPATAAPTDPVLALLDAPKAKAG